LVNLGISVVNRDHPWWIGSTLGMDLHALQSSWRVI
jgi:hypothetical protein